MIAKLRGLIDSHGEDWVVVDVGGVGYLVHCSARTLSRLPAPGQTAVVLVETHVREDAITLYGFAEATERDWFRVLITVQGVGAKVGLALLSVLSPEHLARAIAAQDKAALTRAAGVGPKLALRLLTELRDKVGGIALGAVKSPAAGVRDAGESAQEPARGGGAAADAVSALVNLGYGRSEAFGAVARLSQEMGDGDVSGLVRAALREFARAAEA